MEVIFATSNYHKVRQAASILAGRISFSARSLWIGHEETGTSYLENARLKASAVLRLTGQAVVADDSGLEVDALGGRPGVYSSRFSKIGATDEQNNSKLLRLLSGISDRRARYRCVALLLLPDGTEMVGQGVFEGRVTLIPRGNSGFGYDPLFEPDGLDVTAAEMALEERLKVSHRGQAFRNLLAKVENYLAATARVTSSPAV